MTGHADGLITIDLAESDDARREQRRAELDEPYRTLLGHFRHEVGHFFWPMLVEQAATATARALPGAVRRRAGRLRGSPRAPLRGGRAARLERAPRQHVRDDPSVGGLGRDVRPLPPHPRHPPDRGGLQAVRRRAASTPTDPALVAAPAAEPQRPPFETLIGDWLPLTYALNAVNRSMGRGDLYPFTLAPTVIDKLELRPRAGRSRWQLAVVSSLWPGGLGPGRLARGSCARLLGRGFAGRGGLWTRARGGRSRDRGG